MAFLGLRKWPVPVFKPMWPFMIAGSLTLYLIAKAQASNIRSAEYRNDPRNPYAAQLAKESIH
ncbi:ATP18 subunit J of the mitochondrial F1F0 ATP synthase [Agaricus bisporus var. burnettii JB137-S8]|uniref:ATP18 subunit J of the mitochondrial F1F0 ATP synthase n=1 Tax=Agaricus bisporus var. burnettii (strain JB137-S8 / ATCC MYA-4627 / FGSC 10392) TaxID=597362 RepID=K5X424_AGABU|nr:ATP18 subunit J of the mitochondrial F1F0 ATP synthase [Agaricus bisporus var. bisporus H97]XP_007331902.1 ATP18 subunit J of the mitochondrial F1F0 ATP synthase [Agaricus bisporus var. burnettii JB137-S8]EKM77662.1 ATP18 subunit J of the mitochondrial F1F0 ATP synthase [Agaricus bisporus var. burnettii JB137-S8]EKV43082.1 ATP18 subunit J of the mitochondrial F1F0 ATP synthase [Agaricus bisporus var. bisporus H97]